MAIVLVVAWLKTFGGEGGGGAAQGKTFEIQVTRLDSNSDYF